MYIYEIDLTLWW